MVNVQCSMRGRYCGRFIQHSSSSIEQYSISMTYEFIPLLPLASFLILGLFGHWIKDNAHLVAVPAVLVSWLLSLLVFFDVAGGHQTSFSLYTLTLIHISEPTRLLSISYAVFCLKKKKK